MTSGHFWNCYRDEVMILLIKNDNANNKINNCETTASESFAYKTKTTGSTPNNNNILDAEVVVPLKYLSNFWRSLDFPFISCKIKLDLSWPKDCIISKI